MSGERARTRNLPVGSHQQWGKGVGRHRTVFCSPSPWHVFPNRFFVPSLESHSPAKMNGLEKSLSLFLSQGQSQHSPTAGAGVEGPTKGFRPSHTLPHLSYPQPLLPKKSHPFLQIPHFSLIFSRSSPLQISNSGLIR